MEPDISFLQFGQRSDVLTLEGAISRLFVLGCHINTDNYCINTLVLSQTLLVQVRCGKVLVLFVIKSVVSTPS